MQINTQHIDYFFSFLPCDILSGGFLCSLGLPGGIRGLLQSRLMAQALSQVDAEYCLK